MNDPRFTSGQVGNLTFAHMNSLFEFKAAVESFGPSGSKNAGKTSNPFVVKVLARNGTTSAYKWEEAIWNGSDFQSLANGRRSSNGTDDYAFPLISKDALATNSYVVVMASVSKEASISRPICHPMVSTTTASPVFSAKISSSTQIGTAPLRWRYTWQEMFINSTGTGWTTGTRTGQALNGAEWTTNDGPLVYGVGMEVGTSTTPTLTRKPIRTDVIVMVSEYGGQYWFSMPNGYKVVC